MTSEAGPQLGVRAKLASNLDYLWRSCAGGLSEQNDLFRLTYALETAKATHWNYRLLGEGEWSGRNAVRRGLDRENRGDAQRNSTLSGAVHEAGLME